MDDYKHISFQDWGFQVRITRNKVERSKTFAYNAYGTYNKTLKAARAWRDQMLAALGPVNTKRSGRWFRDKYYPDPKSNNTSGVSGVQVGHNKDGIHNRWRVSWYENGKQKQKTFCFMTSSKEARYREACRFRDKKIKELGKKPVKRRVPT